MGVPAVLPDENTGPRHRHPLTIGHFLDEPERDYVPAGVQALYLTSSERGAVLRHPTCCDAVNCMALAADFG